eukprot:m.327625 g.327625  ORF g.327625 m.327625 type:complete len:266 (-) comp27683_c0_seq7:842-1639(-)
MPTQPTVGPIAFLQSHTVGAMNSHLRLTDCFFFFASNGWSMVITLYGVPRNNTPKKHGGVAVVMMGTGGSNNSAPDQRCAEQPRTMDSVTGLYVDGAVDAAGGQQAFNDVTNAKARAFVMRQEREIREAEEASNLKAERDRQRALAQIAREGMQLDACHRATAQSLQGVVPVIPHAGITRWAAEIKTIDVDITAKEDQLARLNDQGSCCFGPDQTRIRQIEDELRALKFEKKDAKKRLEEIQSRQEMAQHNGLAFNAAFNAIPPM